MSALATGSSAPVDKVTGQVRWASYVRPEQDTNKYFFHGDPLITDRTVIVGTDGVTGGVYAFDKLTGSIRWKYAAGRGVVSAVIGLGRNAYAGTAEGQLICLDLKSGDLRWSFSVNLWGFEGPAAADGRVFGGGRDGNVYALDARTGKILWKKALGAPISTSVTVHGTNIYLGTSTGGIYRLSAENGTIVSTLHLDSGPRGKPLVAGESLLVFVADSEENYHSLVSLDLSLKAERWRQKAPRNWSASRLLVWRDAVVVGTSAGDVMAFRLSDGSPVWRQVIKGRVRSIGGYGDTLFVGTPEGILYAYLPPGK